MIKLQSSSRFLTPAIIQGCFRKGKVTHIDKQLCGNGFSTSFLKIAPSPDKLNIIIAPNKAVIIEKREAYLNNLIETNNRIKFFYSEGKDTNFKDADVLFFVADSFFLMKDRIKEIANRIDKVLVDEFHSVEIQSIYRYVLIDFISKVTNLCDDKNTSIATVTATPNLFSQVDILIENSVKRESNVVVSKNRKNAVKHVKNLISRGENVVICANSSSVIYSLRNYKNELTANFVIGRKLTQSIVELIKINNDPESNLTIVSSRGFEGFDIHYKDAYVFFFEDRSYDHETFFISNLYQAFNRVRSGAQYIEYNRLELSNERKAPFKNIDDEIETFIKDQSISVSEKQKSDYKKYKPFLIFHQDESGVFTVKKNVTSINLYKETLLFDKDFPAPEFKEFLETRGINIEYLSEVNNRILTNVNDKIKAKNLLSNTELIEDLDLFGNGYWLEVKDIYKKNHAPDVDNRELYLKHLNSYLRRKNYSGVRALTERESTAHDLLSNKERYHKLVSDVTKEYDVRSIKKYGVKGSEKHRLEFRSKCYNIVCKAVLMFANDRIGLPSKWIGNRNYNLLVDVGMNEINLIADVFNVRVTEVDIKNCFPRVLYALNGLSLPKDFYGVNKQNKLKINIFLNDFFFNETKGSEKKIQRYNAIVKFRNLGFDESVISYLMDNFFDCQFRGDLFNLLSFHEKKIISDIKSQCANLNNEGVIRRHDSILIFNNKNDLTFLNEYMYKNINGWFDIPEVMVIKLDTEYDSFIKEMELQNKIKKMSGYEYNIYLNTKHKLMAL